MNVIIPLMEGDYASLCARPPPYCSQHARFLDATGLCPTCQREARQQAETRANNEAVRRIAVEAEAAAMAEMYQL